MVRVRGGPGGGRGRACSSPPSHLYSISTLFSMSARNSADAALSLLSLGAAAGLVRALANLVLLRSNPGGGVRVSFHGQRLLNHLLRHVCRLRKICSTKKMCSVQPASRHGCSVFVCFRVQSVHAERNQTNCQPARFSGPLNYRPLAFLAGLPQQRFALAAARTRR